MAKNIRGATSGGSFGYDGNCLFVKFVFSESWLMKSLRQQNRRVISYVPRVEPAPPDHASKVDGFRDVWLLRRGKYVAFVLIAERFCRSPVFSEPAAAQRWAEQMRQEGEVEQE
ncbi:hypothetical protein ENKO_24940 [Enterobacter kobei]|jgi:cell division activator|uniref:Cell division activator CedA n=2 Tax=Enterobacter kobei TaxID=208224 RepID=A0AA86ITD0_9ENTR|nr:hypothetical protein ENKO_24940 [Enterobacter kobei]SIR73816.1 cell division activator [Enterobacter kobei]